MRTVGRSAGLLLVAMILTGLGCAGRSARVPLPPRIQLAEWQTLGILTFGGSSDAALTRGATREFMEMLQAAQDGVRILELGSERDVLSALGLEQLDFQAVRAIGNHFGVDAVFTGELQLGEPTPSVRVGRSFESLRARVDLDALLAAKLLESRSGAVVWSRQASARAPIARVGVAGGRLSDLGASEPRTRYAPLVSELVAQLSPDFHPRWE